MKTSRGKAKVRGPLRVDVTPDWKAHTFQAFAEPAVAALLKRIEREWTLRNHSRGRGRPSHRLTVFAICKEVWLDWGEAFQQGQTISGFTKEVARRFYEREGDVVRDLGRIGEYCRNWLERNVYPEEFPKSFLRSRHGKKKAVLAEYRRNLRQRFEAMTPSQINTLFQGLVRHLSQEGQRTGLPLTPKRNQKSRQR